MENCDRCRFLEEEIQSLREENQMLRQDNQNLGEENQDLRTENQILRAENRNLVEENQNLGDENQNLRAENQDLRSYKENVDEKLTTFYDNFVRVKAEKEHAEQELERSLQAHHETKNLLDAETEKTASLQTGYVRETQSLIAYYKSKESEANRQFNEEKEKLRKEKDVDRKMIDILKKRVSTLEDEVIPGLKQKIKDIKNKRDRKEKEIEELQDEFQKFEAQNGVLKKTINELRRQKNEADIEYQKKEIELKAFILIQKDKLDKWDIYKSELDEECKKIALDFANNTEAEYQQKLMHY